MKKIKIPKRLTRKRALELCVKSWEWMVENPGKWKSDCPYLPNEIENTCWACEFSWRNRDRYCGRNCIVRWRNGHCMNKGSEYRIWDGGIKEAEKVLSACRKSLAKYLEEHK